MFRGLPAAKYGRRMRSPYGACRVSLGLPAFKYGLRMRSPYGACGVSLGLLAAKYGRRMRRPYGACRVSLGLPAFKYGLRMRSPYGACGVSLGLLAFKYGLRMRSPYGACGVSAGLVGATHASPVSWRRVPGGRHIRAWVLRTLLAALCCILVAPPSAAAPADLMEVYLQALESDPRITIAQQKLAMAEARGDGAEGQLYPQVTLSSSLSENRLEYPEEDTDIQEFRGQRYSLQARQMLFNWTKISTHAQARQVVEQYRAELLDMMSLLLVDVADRYFKILLADHDFLLTGAERELAEQQLRQTENMLERKRARITDLLETTARVDQVRTDEIEAANRAALARERLLEITGVPVQQLAILQEDFALPALHHGMEHWTGLALSGNATLNARREAVEAAREGIQMQKGRRYPTLDLVLSSQDSDVGFDNQPFTRRQTEYLGVDIVLPLFSGGSASAGVREAWAQYYLAKAEEETVRREVLRQTREAWLNSRSSRQRIDAARASVISAGKSYEAMTKGFSYGVVTATDVLAALHGQTRARRDYQEAMYSFLVNWLALKRSAGQLQAPDLEQLNSWLVAEQ